MASEQRGLRAQGLSHHTSVGRTVYLGVPRLREQLVDHVVTHLRLAHLGDRGGGGESVD